MFENIINFFKKLVTKDEDEQKSKDQAKERLHLVLMQDRSNVSYEFLDLMKQEIIEVIKKYIEVDEDLIDVRVTNTLQEDNKTTCPTLYANIPIENIKKQIKQNEENTNKKVSSEEKININKVVNIKQKTKQDKKQINTKAIKNQITATKSTAKKITNINPNKIKKVVKTDKKQIKKKEFDENFTKDIKQNLENTNKKVVKNDKKDNSKANTKKVNNGTKKKNINIDNKNNSKNVIKKVKNENKNNAKK